MPKTIACRQLLGPDGWRDDQSVTIDAQGRIAEIGPSDNAAADVTVDILVPAPANLHSHAFQRAMAGMTEARGREARDSFWTWRALMYRFLDVLTPDDVEAIAAWMQVESLEAGFGSVGEFHYLHHQPDGAPYAARAEMAERIAAASGATGCGLTLLPVLYMQGGCDGRALGRGQRRFGCNLDSYARLVEDAGRAVGGCGDDARLGVAPHSLRAVSPVGLARAVEIAGERPIHLHLAEQVAEVEEVEAALGARPATWLLENAEVDARWCLIHATQLLEHETAALARSGAVAGLCPITEANLGDGIFDGVRFVQAGGRFGVGSDSNVRVDLAGELRQFEYSQRLRDRSRAVLADETRSTGRRLLEDAAIGGAQALGRGSGSLRIGDWADLLALDASAIDLIGKVRDAALDAWIFAGAERAVAHVWSAGRHVVVDGRHGARETVRGRYVEVVKSLEARL